MTNDKGQTLRCPRQRQAGVAEENDIIGCGSEHITGPDHEGYYDCLDCGINFREPEMADRLAEFVAAMAEFLDSLEVDDVTNQDEESPTVWLTGNIKLDKLKRLRALANLPEEVEL